MHCQFCTSREPVSLTEITGSVVLYLCRFCAQNKHNIPSQLLRKREEVHLDMEPSLLLEGL